MKDNNGYNSLLGSAALFGLFGVLIQWNSRMFGDFTQIGIRNIVALAILAAILLIKRPKIDLSMKRLPRLVLFNLATLSAITFITLSFLETSIKNAVVFRYFADIIVAFGVSTFLLKEKITRAKLISIPILFVGMIVYLFPLSWSDFNLGLLFALLGGLMVTITNYLRRFFSDYSTEELNISEFSTFAIVSLVIASITRDGFVTGFDWLAIVSVALAGIAVVLVTYLITYGFRRTDLNLGTIIMTTEIFFSLVIAYVLLGQGFTIREFVGAVIIFLAAVLPNLKNLTNKNAQKNT